MMFVSSKSNTMGGNGAGTTYPTTVPEFTPRLGLCCSIFSFLCRDLSTIVCLFVGLHSVYIWFTFGLHLVYIWFTFGLHLVYIWFTFGLHLVYIWSTFSLHLVYIWSTFGLYLVYIWPLYCRSFNLRLLIAHFVIFKLFLILIFSHLF